MLHTIGKYFELVKISHTIFALPFAAIAFLSVIYQYKLGFPENVWPKAFWILVAMVGARSGAMGFNRLIDRKWDRLNPRTKNRPSVSGKISLMQMQVMISLSFMVFIIAAWNLNFLAFALSPAAIFILCFYSYTKRFTAYSHLFLGAAIGLTPSAVWIAMTGGIPFSVVLLSVSIGCWIAGFDILYALQDKAFDKANKLYSIPAKFGTSSSLWFSRVLHLLAILGWFLFSHLNQHGLSFNVGISLCAVLLVIEHKLVNKEDLNHIHLAFFKINSYISVILLLFYSLDLYVQHY